MGDSYLEGHTRNEQAQDCKIRKGEKSTQASLWNPRTAVVTSSKPLLAGEEPEARIAADHEVPSRAEAPRAPASAGPWQAAGSGAGTGPQRSRPRFPALSLGGLGSAWPATANAAALADGAELIPEVVWQERGGRPGFCSWLKSWLKIACLRSIDTQSSAIRLGKSIKSVWFLSPSPQQEPGNCTKAGDQRPTGTGPWTPFDEATQPACRQPQAPTSQGPAAQAEAWALLQNAQETAQDGRALGLPCNFLWPARQRPGDQAGRGWWQMGRPAGMALLLPRAQECGPPFSPSPNPGPVRQHSPAL